MMVDGIPGKYRHIFYRNVRFQDAYGTYDGREQTTDKHKAQVVSSENEYGLHTPVLDIDMYVEAIPSSTEGHYHLYIDHLMTWRQYKRLLKALARAGVIEKGYAKASIERRYSAVRVPWLRKKELV